VIEDLKVELARTPIANATRRDDEPERKVRLLKPKTIHNCLTVLRRTLSIGRKRGLIETVPRWSGSGRRSLTSTS
jgi:hypothetical protein